MIVGYLRIYLICNGNIDRGVAEMETPSKIESRKWPLNAERKDFSKSKRINYARKLERIGRIKARERMSDGGKGCQNSDNLRTDEIVAKKISLRINELERIYGIKHGNNQRTSNNYKSSKSQEELASDLGISISTLQNYKRLADMIPELEELIDTGIVTKSTALAMIKNLSEDEQLNLEISENETRKDFSRSEMVDYARRLERIERLKAERNRLANLKQNSDSLKSDSRGRTDEVVARKLGIGGKDTYRKEKFIVDNKDSLTPEDFADWDEGKLSTNKAFNKIKEY